MLNIHPIKYIRRGETTLIQNPYLSILSTINHIVVTAEQTSIVMLNFDID